MVLHGECRNINALQAFNHVVIQIDVADEHLAVLAVFKRRVNGFADRRVNSKAVVVRGDFDFAGGHVFDRLIDAAVTELQLICAEAERTAEQLVTEADAEERMTCVKYLAKQVHFRISLFRISRTVGEEDTVRIEGFKLIERDGGWHHMYTAATLGHTMRSHGLDAEIDRGDGEQRFLAFEFTTRLDGIGFFGADFVVEAHPLHLRSGLDLVKHGLDGTQLAIGVKQSITGENTCTHHACGTQVAYKLASVDSADANDVIGFQIVIEAAGGTPIAHIRAGIAHNITGNPDS